MPSSTPESGRGSFFVEAAPLESAVSSSRRRERGRSADLRDADTTESARLEAQYYPGSGAADYLFNVAADGDLNADIADIADTLSSHQTVDEDVGTETVSLNSQRDTYRIDTGTDRSGKGNKAEQIGTQSEHFVPLAHGNDDAMTVRPVVKLSHAVFTPTDYQRRRLDEQQGQGPEDVQEIVVTNGDIFSIKLDINLEDDSAVDW